MDLYRLSRRREPNNTRPSRPPVRVNQFEQIVSIQGTTYPSLSQWFG